MSFFFGGGGSSLGSSVESSEITDGTIVNADVNASAAISPSKLDTTAAATFASLNLTGDSNQIVLDSDEASGFTTTVTASATAARTLTMPDATDTLVGKATTDTFTNKTFDANGTGNSLSNVDVADLASGTDGELITWDASGNPATVAVGSSGQVLTSNGAGAAPTFQASGGDLVQQVRTTSSTYASTTSQIPTDNTIPQNTEGTEVGTLAITPTNSSNILVIDFSAQFALNAANACVVALFQDSTANALHATLNSKASGAPATHIFFRHYMVSGTTSSTTFKIRMGNSDGTTTVAINGNSGANLFGGVEAWNITITEIAV